MKLLNSSKKWAHTLRSAVNVAAVSENRRFSTTVGFASSLPPGLYLRSTYQRGVP